MLLLPYVSIFELPDTSEIGTKTLNSTYRLFLLYVTLT